MKISRELFAVTAVEPPRWIGWMPLVVLPTVAVVATASLAPWIFMWVLAGALWAGCKWMVLWREVSIHGCPNLRRALAFLFLWIGMEARAFLNEDNKVVRPTAKQWASAMAKILLGIVLTWFVARQVTNELMAVWIALVGLIFILHFGVFHLLSLIWQERGVDAPPLMRAPILATSLTEFWGHRWNTGFHKLAADFVFRPMARIGGIRLAMLATFLVSGVVHDLVISVPARGGYGWPTAYFLAQGSGVLIEKSKLGRRLGLQHGVHGWLFTVAATAGPVFWLFHPPFAKVVIVPFLHALHAF